MNNIIELNQNEISAVSGGDDSFAIIGIGLFVAVGIVFCIKYCCRGNYVGEPILDGVPAYQPPRDQGYPQYVPRARAPVYAPPAAPAAPNGHFRIPAGAVPTPGLQSIMNSWGR